MPTPLTTAQMAVRYVVIVVKIIGYVGKTELHLIRRGCALRQRLWRRGYQRREEAPVYQAVAVLKN